MQLLYGVRYVVFGCRNYEERARAGPARGELRGEASASSVGFFQLQLLRSLIIERHVIDSRYVGTKRDRNHCMCMMTRLCVL